MTNVIEELRKHNGASGDDTDDQFNEIDEILDAYKPEGYTVEEVYEEFEEAGRWSNYKTKVYRVDESSVTAYFELWEEVPATEMQDGQDCSWGFNEVEPKEVTVIKYVAKEGR